MTIETPNADTANANASQEVHHEQSPSWWIDEGIPGVGEKPAWLGEKFKSAADLAKSYQELEKRVGTVPDNYDFSKSKFIDPEYGPFKDFQEYAKSKRVPQDVMDKMQESLDKYMSEFSVDYQEERKKLGENAKERLATVNNWAKANLSEDSFTALTSQLHTAEAVMALEELRNKVMSNTTVIPGNNDGSSNGATLEDVQAELTNNLEKYKSDPKYRKEMQLKIEQAAKYSEFVDKTR